VNLDGVTLEDSGNRVLEPGHGSGTGNSRGFLYCKFTVVNGTRADIRAGMSVCTNAACRENIPAD
jgi:hypothetical protein